jgi:hypothetical protein
LLLACLGVKDKDMQVRRFGRKRTGFLGDSGIIERQPAQGDSLGVGEVNKFRQALGPAGIVVSEFAKIYFQQRTVFAEAWVEVLRLGSAWEYKD